MPEKTDMKNSLNEDKQKSGGQSEEERKGSWSEDQKNRSYYYDDASGYQVYLPDEDDEEDKPDN